MTQGTPTVRGVVLVPGDRDRHNLTHPKKLAVLTAYGRFGTVTRACEASDVAPKTHYRWLEADPAYREAFIDAHREYCERLQEEIRRRAVDGDEEEVRNPKTGEVIGTKRRKSDLLLIFEAKGRMPHIYRDNAPLPAQPGPDVARQLAGLSRDQLRELIDNLESGEAKQLPPAPPLKEGAEQS